MLRLFSKKEKIRAIDSGQVIPLSQVPDEAFSSKMIGDGFAIAPETGSFKSPVTGQVIQVFPTGHALGIKSEQGVEILIHIGIDTVDLAGQGFQVQVAVGDQVNAGDLLVKADLDFIKAKGKSIVTPIIFTNKDTYKEFDVTYGVVKSSHIGNIIL